MGAWWFTAIATLVTGFCYAIQKYLKWVGRQLPARATYYNDGIAYYFKTILILLLVRSFIVEWSIIPSGSLKPTLLVGDLVLTDKLAYGVRLPLTGHLLIPLSAPKRGDVVAFRYPVEPSKTLMKRLIGLPGDRIQYYDKKLVINGVQAPQVEIGLVHDQGVDNTTQSWLLCEENLQGCLHLIYTTPPETGTGRSLTQKEVHKPIDVTVPSGHYFVMGDNRDYSLDSRVWGCVPDYYLLGKAKRVYISLNKPSSWWKPYAWVRWTRIGMKIR
jgi:signal peptidase I